MYNSNFLISRRIEIIFICDRYVGRGFFVFVDEGLISSGIYIFVWNIEYVCFSSLIECTVIGGGR